MQSNIKRIIDTDATLRTETEWLEKRKENLASEIENTRATMLRDLMANADAEISKKLISERKRAEAAWSTEKIKYKKIEDALTAVSLEKRGEWARDIFSRVKGGGQ